MAVIGLGTDIIEIDRIEKAADRKFLGRFFSDMENSMFAAHRMRRDMIAGNFAAKESLVKALGTGFKGIDPRDVETLRDENGKPYINLYGVARQAADKLGVTNIHVSISHSREYATAFVVLETLAFNNREEH